VPAGQHTFSLFSFLPSFTTVNKGDLDTLVSILPGRVMERVSQGLRWFLKLEV